MNCSKKIWHLVLGLILCFSAQVNAQNTDMVSTLSWVQEKFKLYGQYDDRSGSKDKFNKYYFSFTEDGFIRVVEETIMPDIIKGDFKVTTVSTVKLRNLDKYVNVYVDNEDEEVALSIDTIDDSEAVDEVTNWVHRDGDTESEAGTDDGIYLIFDIEREDIVRRISKALEHAIKLSKEAKEPF